MRFGRRQFLASVAVAALGAGAEVPAHHSVAGQFDLKSGKTLTGVISDIEWINPHIYIHLDVTSETGGQQTWRLESVPPSYLRKARITRDMLIDAGNEVSIDILLPRDGTAGLGFVRVIRYADGREYQLAAE